MGTPDIDLNALAAGLDPAKVTEVADFIEWLRAKQDRDLPAVLRDAPWTDEPLTDEVRAAIAEAEAEPGSISLEQVKAELGL